jgi:hypothetical protein
MQSSRPPPLPSEAGVSVSVVGQAQQFRQVGGQITAVKQFEYRVTATRTGTWQVGPVELRLSDGTVVSAPATSVEVVERSEAPGEVRDVEVEAGFDTQQAYEGQVVVYRYQLRTRRSGASAEWQLPTFDGLRQPQHGQPDSTAYVIDDPTGAITVQEGVVPLLAVATGTREQGAAIAHVRIPTGQGGLMSFRPLRREPYATLPATLEILPLPSPQPDGFSGLVGEFTVRSELDKDVAAVGESVNWTVQIRGDGALEGFTLPTYEVPEASVYENDDRVVATVDDGRYAAAAAFRRVLVPTVEGVLQPPPLTLITFSPEKGEYVTHEIEVGSIRVTPGREGDGAVTSFASDDPAVGEVEAEVVDFRPIRARGSARALPLAAVAPVLGGLLALPGLGLLLLEGGLVVRRRLRERVRADEAPRAASSWLSQLPGEVSERLASLDAALRAAREIHGDDPRIRALQARIGRARFAGGDADDRTLEADVRALVAELEAA